MLLSPACGPAPVTRVPVTSTRGERDALRTVNWRNGFGTECGADAVVGLADLDVEQHRQPHHRHRGQQVDGDRPPQQAGQHGDAADHRLHHRRRRHQPGVDQHLAAPAGPRDGQHRSAAVSTTRKVIIRLPNSTAWWMTGTSACGTGVKLPGKHCGQVGQPRPGRGDAHDRAGDGDAALGQDHQQRR